MTLPGFGPRLRAGARVDTVAAGAAAGAGAEEVVAVVAAAVAGLSASGSSGLCLRGGITARDRPMVESSRCSWWLCSGGGIEGLTTPC